MKWVVLFDVPSIKQYVFGSDALAEIRGASALLDWLNREQMHSQLRDALPAGAKVEVVYAAGGFAQFVITADHTADIEAACQAVERHVAEQTGGAVQPVYGFAPLAPNDYAETLSQAFFQLRMQREMGGTRPTVAQFPLLAECQSLAHLPAEELVSWGGEQLALSEVAARKRRFSRQATRYGAWAKWMKHLAKTGPWPKEPDQWQQLRPDTFEAIGSAARGRNYLGIVYADGNAMGRIVRGLDSEQACRAFSRLVDNSVHDACFEALDTVCAHEIADIREGGRNQGLPVDILLLGGDDLLVALPIDRALDFARHATRRFSELTAEAIQQIPDQAVRHRLQELTGNCGLSISCGVAFARPQYPFYLLLELSEALLRSAKRAGDIAARDANRTVPEPHIDFHLVTGGHSVALDELRRTDYGVTFHAPPTAQSASTAHVAARTLRPYSLGRLDLLRDAVLKLRAQRFPRSKIHALYDAALEPNPARAEQRLRELFARCRIGKQGEGERRALWEATRMLCPNGYTYDYPWFKQGNVRVTPIADLAEAYDLFCEP